MAQSTTYRAMRVEEESRGRFVRRITEQPQDALPEGEVLISVHYSSLNYKDALSATGNKGVTRHYPHTPGIDAAGVVLESASHEVRPGEEVIVTGYELGANHPGGYAELIRVPAEWVVHRPATLTLRESMIYGTAGFTAGLSLRALLDHGVTPDRGPVLVTGATGGVGSFLVALLAQAGFAVTAVTGKPERAEFLRGLGAAEVIDRAHAQDESGRPLLKGRWAGVADTVGGPLLESALKATQIGAAVTCCGHVARAELATTVFPFILRGVSLLGIDSAHTPREPRARLWDLLAGTWRIPQLAELAEEVTLEALEPKITAILAGQLTGRTVVRLLP